MPHVVSYLEAIEEVRARVKKAKTSFAAGMRTLPGPKRDAMYALYAFCREVDDIADDSPTAEERDEGLAMWKRRIEELFARQETPDAITTALLPAIEAYGLLEKDFQDIIRGMEMDAATPIKAPSMEEFDLYCDLVASAVGRVSVRIFGDPSEEAQQVAYYLGRALQTTNILRDLAEDAARERLYIPADILARHGIETHNPAEVLREPNLPAACRELASLADRHFERAEEWMRKCTWENMRAARTMRNYYREILRKLREADWRNPKERISLTLKEKLLLFIRSVLDSKR